MENSERRLEESDEDKLSDIPRLSETENTNRPMATGLKKRIRGRRTMMWEKRKGLSTTHPTATHVKSTSRFFMKKDTEDNITRVKRGLRNL
jgi:hypothetical protein